MNVLQIICLPTEHQRAVLACFKGDHAFQVELELKSQLVHVPLKKI